MTRIRLKYVHCDIDRHGNARYYFKKRGAPKKLRLPGHPGSGEFMAAYAAALAGLPLPQTGQVDERPDIKRVPSGTLDWLIAAYFQSSEFKQLVPDTQKNKRSILRRICDEKHSPGSTTRFGDMPYAEMTPKAARVLRDRRADKPATARNWLAMLNALFKWAIEADHCAVNPVRDVPKPRFKSEGHHTWTPEEMRAFEAKHPLGSQARLAFALLAYTGQRVSDIVRLGPQHMTKGGCLKFTQKKNEKRAPVVVEIPILPELQRVIDATPTGHLTFMVNSLGRAMKERTFANRMREWCDEAGLPHCSSHGMRKAAAVAAGEGGASELQMMAIFGWRDPAMARVYTEKARRGKMAAESMHLLANRQNTEGTNVSHFRVDERAGGKNRPKN